MDNDPNLAELYPADAAYWRDIEIISAWQAVLLSLGIEPRVIHELSCLRDPEDEADVICYGQQEQDYVRRGAALRNAVAAKSLAVAATDNPSYAGHIYLKAFVVWANGKGWSMPDWMLGMGAPQTNLVAPSSSSAVRERKKAETQDRHQQWQSRADELHASHTRWTVSQIAKKIAEECDVAASTVRNNIKIK